MYPTITIVFRHLSQAPRQIGSLLKCASTNLDASPFLFFFSFYNHKHAGSIPESKLKSKISHSLIHMDFIGLVTWSGGKRAIKISERLKKCLKVILSKNLACTFIHSNFFGLGFTPFVLFINLYCTFVPSL